MITLSNGHKLRYVASSGALGYFGQGWLWERPLVKVGIIDPTLFTVTAKTITYNAQGGNLRWYNPFRAVRFIKDGVLNAVALSNPGIKWACDNLDNSLLKKVSLVASIIDEDWTKLVAMAEILNKFDLKALELNASCPNIVKHGTEEIIGMCCALKVASRFPIILKLSVDNDTRTIVRKVEGLVEAVSINSVPWDFIFKDLESPLRHFGGGGVSGKAAQPFTWELASQLSKITSIPIIWPSVWEYSDIEKLWRLGAKAISFGSVFLRYPWRPTMFVRRDMKENV